MQLIVRQASNNDHPSNKKAYYPFQCDNLGFIELRRGIFHSVRPAIGKMILVVDTTVAAFYTGGDLIDALLKFFESRNVRELQNLSPSGLKNAERCFKKVIITETKGTPPRTGRKRTIKGFHPDGALFKFTGNEGEQVTIEQHYMTVHNVRLAYPRLPGVVLRDTPGREEIVPMELCKIEPGQFYKKALPENVQSRVLTLSTMKPVEKMSEISKAAMHYPSSTSLHDTGMVIDTRPIVVDATLMRPPKIEFGNGSMEVQRGAWNLLHRTLRETVHEVHWAVINLAPTEMAMHNGLREHLDSFMDCLNKLGIPLKRPIHVATADVSSGAGDQSLFRDLNGLLQSVKSNTTPEIYEVIKAGKFFILCILSKDRAWTKVNLKNWGDINTGVITQCVRVEKLRDLTRSRKNPAQYWANVGLKINARLGGENFKVAIQQSGGYDAITCTVSMVVGADVSHPSPGTKAPSVATLAYSHTQFATKYRASATLQDPRQEVFADLQRMMREAIEDVHRGTPRPIDNIIFFRDGVSEGEYTQIQDVEIAAIKKAIDEVWTSEKFKALPKEPPKPKLTFIVVGKRHHTLFFSKGQREGQIDNCPAGLVVNQQITQPDIQDFYLQSHSAIIGIFPNDTKKLAYALCHVYAKATRSVSIPAPSAVMPFGANVEEQLRASDRDSVVDGERVPFDLGPWKEAFRPLNHRLHNSMYFL
ncbi:Piwi domain-containing protein [Ephemerocybe angulata]|uniref:Piwi domain-containing protein n=1 Tax=Ephemerocybe angulata TaxID=980116 RepID=A0A8H6MG28_9AGAR|nr:Piwi domain-containing protein [Tulosesus angulatus]